MYQIGLALVPLSFVIMGILGGGAATLLKKLAAVDLRGRRMELVVVLATVWLTLLSWGLLRAFFGNSSACYGVAGKYSVSAEDLSSTYLLRFLHWSVFSPSEFVFRSLDSKIAGALNWTGMCTVKEGTGCLEHLGNSNASFFLRDTPHNEQCAADLLLVSSLYIAAVCSFVGSTALKHHERQQRRRRHLHHE